MPLGQGYSLHACGEEETWWVGREPGKHEGGARGDKAERVLAPLGPPGRVPKQGL